MDYGRTNERSVPMMSEHCYSVGGFVLSVSLPSAVSPDILLPSFRPFKAGGSHDGVELLRFAARPLSSMPEVDVVRLLDDSDNDMGHIRLYSVGGGYLVELCSAFGGACHRMLASPDFSRVCAYVRWEDACVGLVVSSFVRIAYSQAVLGHGAVSLHAAAVCHAGRAYLFMGRSGTGKSTHASLWLKHIAGAELLNDDNPTVRIVGGEAVAYGTPWSGKTPCYRQLAFPIDGIVRLVQAPSNRFKLLEDIDAFIAIYPGCSVIAEDMALCNGLYDTLVSLAGLVRVGTLECLPDREAALLCHDSLAARPSV